MHWGEFSDSSQNRDIEQLADKDSSAIQPSMCTHTERETETTPHGGDPRERMGEADERKSAIGRPRGSCARARDGVR
jgi:hypothetical protein